MKSLIEIIGGVIIAFLFWVVVIDQGRVLSSSEITQEGDTVCALQERSDKLTVYCVFDAVGYEEKEACYEEVIALDRIIVEKGLEGHVCESNLSEMWEERRKRK
jgi:hypothetical protein